MTYKQPFLRDPFLFLTSTHFLVQSILIEIKRSDINAFRVRWLQVFEGTEGLATLKIEVRKTVVSKCLQTFWRQGGLNELWESGCSASCDEALFDHLPILESGS